ncbi:MAG: ribonuclease E inhibitor RraB [Steroidobacteraceae bacterium]|nr:ribonuclease E inhibitor RraB [Steroidobacteraceae bacterium]
MVESAHARRAHRLTSHPPILCSLAGCAREESDPDDIPDSVVVENLRDAGSDLSKPHAVDFNLYFPDEDWAVEATKMMIPNADEITQVGKSVRALAEAEGGEYDEGRRGRSAVNAR